MPPRSEADAFVTSEKIIAEELTKLSLHEREKAYEDVHGVSDTIEESPKFIANRIQAMEHELQSISGNSAYEKARRMSTAYVTNPKRQLKFLRASLFNPKQAAQRIMQFFKIKLDLFGAEKLIKDITISDLGEEGLRALQLGAQEILPMRDSKGRAVIFSNQKLFLAMDAGLQNPVLALKRSFWYMVTKAAEDEETQRKGLIYIAYAVDSNHEPNEKRLELLRYCSKLGNCIPAKTPALHMCFNSSRPAPFWKAIVFGTGAFLRVRIRPHAGSHCECLYSLASFGIPVQDIPLTPTGELKNTNHLKWIQRRLQKEQFLQHNKPKRGARDLPARQDVLLGRGRPFIAHPGNKRLNEIVSERFELYDSLLRVGKTKMAEDIVAMVTGYGGSFLKLDESSGMWVEVSDLEARNKVAHGFRRKREVALKAAANKGRAQVTSFEGTEAAYVLANSKRLKIVTPPPTDLLGSCLSTTDEVAKCNFFLGS